MADLADGESIEVQESGKAPYVLKNVGGVYSCTCPAWRNQSLGIEARTCKHLRKLRRDQAENDRVGGATPVRKAADPASNSGDANAKVASDAKAGPPLLLAHSWEN